MKKNSVIFASLVLGIVILVSTLVVNRREHVAVSERFDEIHFVASHVDTPGGATITVDSVADTFASLPSSVSPALSNDLGQKRSQNINLSTIEKQTGLSFQDSYKVKRLPGGRTTKENLMSVINGGGSSYRLMEFSRGIGALLAMFETTSDVAYLEEVLDFTELLISVAQKGRDIKNNPPEYTDDYYGWANINRSNNTRTGRHLEEYPLHESYLFRYLAKAVYLIDKSAATAENRTIRARSQVIQDFIETNGWEKWYNRGEKDNSGCYSYLFRSRTHMTAHWAIVALYLRELTDNNEKRGQYNHFLSLYDKQLRDNLRLNDRNAYIWNMTWDSHWPYNTKCNKPAKNSIIQDASHGNHVVTYIVEAYELSVGSWDKLDIDRLSNTVKYVLYDQEKQLFNGDLNQNFIPNMANGLRLSDGFLKLARYDIDILNIATIVRNNQYKESDFNYYEAQYVAELLLAEKRRRE